MRQRADARKALYVRDPKTRFIAELNNRIGSNTSATVISAIIADFILKHL